jgi:hypothetical protein
MRHQIPLRQLGPSRGLSFRVYALEALRGDAHRERVSLAQEREEIALTISPKICSGSPLPENGSG